MRNENLLLLVAAAILGTAALPEVGWTQEDRSQAQAVASGPQQIEMTVHGLSCPFCAYGLEKKLRKLEGLDSQKVLDALQADCLTAHPYTRLCGVLAEREISGRPDSPRSGEHCAYKVF